MADVERVRLEVAFTGGQVIGIVVAAPTADELEQALEHGRQEALHLDADDGRYTVPLAQIVYVKRFSRESRVGFGNQTVSR